MDNSLESNVITKDGEKYFVIGKNRIKITEYFTENDVTIEDLLENLIRSVVVTS